MFLQIIIWILFFVTVFVLADFLFISRGINYFHKFYIVAIYYLICSALAFLFYRDLVCSYFQKANTWLVLILIGVVALSLLIIPHLDKKWRIPKNFSAKQNRLFFLRMDYRMLTAKVADIFFQEIMILALLLILSGGGVRFEVISWIFVLVFPVAHLLLIFTEGWFSLFYILSALLGSIFLPLVILKTDSGFYWAIASHWVIYLVGRFGFGLYFETHRPRHWFFSPYWVRKEIRKLIMNN
jgi:hypothetical protein